MEILVSQEQARTPVTVLKPVGRINLGNADELLKKAQEAFEHGMRDCIIDLSEVPSITSAGLRVINAIYKLLHGEPPASGEDSLRGGEERRPSPHLKLLNPDAEVRRVLHIAGFDLFIEIYADKQEALGAF